MDKLRIPYSIIETAVERRLYDDIEKPEDYVCKLALQKAKNGAESVGKGVVVAADTIAFYKGQILGKPKDAEDAKRMLRLLSGDVHEVLTGLAVVDAEKLKRTVTYVKTRVKMKDLAEEEINCYVSTGESSGKAGSYAIQGLGAILIEWIEGSFYNVVGLPLAKLAELLKEFGIEVFQLIN